MRRADLRGFFDILERNCAELERGVAEVVEDRPLTTSIGLERPEEGRLEAPRLGLLMGEVGHALVRPFSMSSSGSWGSGGLMGGSSWSVMAILTALLILEAGAERGGQRMVVFPEVIG